MHERPIDAALFAIQTRCARNSCNFEIAFMAIRIGVLEYECECAMNAYI